jgi:putative ABC transport system permease protein
VRLLEAVRLALAQIRVQKLKSFFTLIGVAIGVMFLIAVVSIVEGMGRYMEEDLVGKIIAKGSFELRSRPNIQLGDVDEAEWRSWRNRPRITEDDVEPVSAVLAPGTSWAMLGFDQLPSESQYARPKRVEVNCVSEQWFEIRNMVLQSGRFPSSVEYAMGTPVVVIGEDVKNHFFPNLDPLGRDLRIGGIPYQVIGVAEKQGNIFGISLDKFVVVPYEAPAHRLVNRFKVIDAVIIKSVNETAMQSDMENVREVMRAAADAAAEDGQESPPPNDYYVRNLNTTLRTVAVGDDVMVVWYPEIGDPTSETTIAYDEWRDALADRGEFTLGIWIEVENGVISHMREQWVP